MFQRLLALSVMLLIADGGFVAAQERFELAVPLSSTKSTADLTAATLTITNNGKASVYSRDAKYDAPGFVAYSSTTLRQVIRWPNKGSGTMQIGTLTGFGAPLFRPSQMQITRVGGTPPPPPGTVPPPLPGGPVDINRSYRLTNGHLGPGRSLASDPGGITGMNFTGDIDSQSWQFVAAGPGTYRLINVALGNKFSLTSGAIGSQPTMQLTDQTSKAQLWRLTPQGTTFQLTNEALGPGAALDTDSAAPNTPFMAASSNATGQSWTLTKLEIEPTSRYRLTNEFLKAGRSLGAHASGATEMATTGQLDSQLWQFVLAGPQSYRITNVALGDKFSLAASTVDPRPTMKPTDITSNTQLWRIVSEGTTFRLINEALGPGFSLDNDGTAPNDPVMAPTGKLTGQFWTLTELPDPARGGIVGSWESLQVGTNQPQGARIDIQNDLSFRITEPGNPDRVGTVQLVGDRLIFSYFGGTPDQFRVTLVPNRVDFQTMSGIPTGYYWQRTNGRPFTPVPALPRLVSREVIPNPPLEPVTVALQNTHSNELWVLVTDLRDPKQSMRLKIPPDVSTNVILDRDAGARVIETWRIPLTGIEEVREVEVPPALLYDMSVYEIAVLSVVRDRTTNRGGGRINNVIGAPKSVGLYPVPPGNHLLDGTLDIYAAAKREENTGAVRRIDPKKWEDVGPKGDLESLVR
ncbi:MAG: RICIN domain-containing protein [Planctomycetaceae bacterium]|nr:RICIN domain-containing protein [Planctomycetaceae bacterium]MCB9949684.1 RICIN domain-containing protein [Planctomycetaceae bacterium]